MPSHASGATRVRSHLPALTGVRFLAAFWVVVFHFVRPERIPARLLNFVGHGYAAVGLFFILSGFILTINYLDLQGRFLSTPAEFWKSRLTRVYPVYIAALILSIGVVLTGWRAGHDFRSLGHLMWTGILTAVMQQSWLTSTATLWNAPAWSLSVEAFFYLTFPFLIRVIARIPARRLPAALVIAFLVAMLGPLLGFWDNPTKSYDALPTDFPRFLLMVNPLLRLPEFVFGILLGRLWQHESMPSRAVGPLTIIFGSAAALVLFSGSVPRVFIGNGLLAPFWAVLICALAQGWPAWLYQFLSSRPMVALGEASYGMYILQVPVGFYFFRWYHGPAGVITYLVLLTVLSLLSFHYFETPARRWLRGRRALPGTAGNQRVELVLTSNR